MSTDETHNYPPREQPSDETSAFDPEAQLDQVIAEHLKALESGQAPDQQELLARYPQFADELKEFLADRSQFEHLAGPIREAVGTAPPVGSHVRYVGDYELLDELGRGGMGVVYKAQQVSLKRLVALKMILAGEHASDQDLARFRSEAEAVAQLRHPGIVQIHEIGEHEGNPYAALEYVEGGSLADQLDGTPLSPQRAAELTELLARAIQIAHQAGIVHRDLKPANVLLTQEGKPRITDFGLAKLMKEESGKTRTGAILGTPSYMAPEQAEGKNKEIGPAADVYALGAILYELLTGRPPFRAETPLDTILQVATQEPVSPRELQPRLSRDLETICLKCLQKDPQKRYATAEALAEDLQRFQNHEPIQARPVGRIEKTWRWCRRNPAVAFLLTLVVMLLLAGTGVSSHFVLQALQEAEIARRERDQKQTLAEKEKKARERAERQELIAKSERDQKQTFAEKERKARLKAERQEQKAREAVAREKKERHRAEWLLYASQLKLAQQLWSEGKVSLARNALASTRWDFRRWEYQYLHTVLHKRGQVTFRGHLGYVQCVTFSPDGRRFASAGSDRRVMVRDAHTGEELLTFRGHKGIVYTVGFSPDGTKMVSAGRDQTIKVWDAHTGEELLALHGHASFVRSAVFSPDGSTIISGSTDKTVKTWNATTGEAILTLKKHNGPVSSVAVSPDGQRIVSGSEDNTVKIWDATTGKELLALRGHTEAVFTVAYSPDSRNIISGGKDKTVKMWDARTGQELLAIGGHTTYVKSVAFSPDGSRIVSNRKVWDAKTGEQIFRLQGHSLYLHSVAFSPDGQRILSGSADSTVKLWNARTGQELLSLRGHPAAVFGLAWSPDGRRIVSTSDDQTLKMWDAKTRKELRTFKGHTNSVYGVAFSSDGTRIVSGSRDKTLRVWDAHTGEELLTIRGHLDTIWGVAFSPDGTKIVSGSWDQTARVWDARTGEELLTLSGHSRAVRGIAFSPGGHRIVSGSYDRTIKVWDVRSGEELLTFKGHTFAIRSVAFSPDGSRIVSASEGDPVKRIPGELKLWDAETGQELFALKGHTRNISTVAFSPDGQRIVSGSNDQTLKIWDTSTGQELLSLSGHTGYVYSAVFSPDGRTILSAGGDQMIKMWEAYPGQNVHFLRGHTTSVARVAFDSQGSYILSQVASGKTIIWDLKTGREVSEPPKDLIWTDKLVSPDGTYRLEIHGRVVNLVPSHSRLQEQLEKLASTPDWHEKQAQQREKEGEWFAAAFHLNQLLTYYPWSARLHVRRAYVLRHLGKNDPALQHYLLAVFLRPEVDLGRVELHKPAINNRDERVMPNALD